ncbi:glycosyltransferase family 2 protein [Agrobacterium larrymoorei]|uniref:Glycosyltransferase involved in cell wall biosynthesis n=1 Tax=Agrobacterium larrymoorei TaxID=160699 RepID=A0ABU0UEP6_9HYPH|nr:glycosyltransferase [Agrobacterium larrymoorei]MDQ1183363.1 glycosyltransferase involved in cell wall biosynthesis [Agrobacterium larrymoorei]
MKLSVILKTLNEENRIGAAIESVIDALKAVPDIESEIIVADSGSKDRTIEIASRYPVIIAQIQAPAKASCGVGPQLGFQYSKGEFVALMDGDMLLDPTFLTEAFDYLDKHPRVAGVSGDINEVNLDNLEFTRRVQRIASEVKHGVRDRLNGGGVYRRAAIEEAGYFSDRNLHAFEEFDLAQRLRLRGWTLYRLDRRYVDHFGHNINSYVLLTRRWSSKYLLGTGELLRAGWQQGRFKQIIQENPEIKLWLAVYAWWAILLFCLIGSIFHPIWLIAFVALLALPVVAMSIKKKSLELGLYAIVAWCFHAAALPFGLISRRKDPGSWIESRLLKS